MFTSVWLMSTLALIVVDVRTGALQQKDPVTHRCFSCVHNDTVCEVTSLLTLECPLERPLCSTSAVAPNFTSTLNCAPASNTPCSLIHTSDIGFQFTCVCREDYCNVPFAVQIRKKLLEFLSSNYIDNNATDNAEAFFKYANITGDVYKQITVPPVQPMKAAQNLSVHSTLASKTISVRSLALSHVLDVIMPRAEALKQQATVPSDDDEDDSEGSGAYEETKTLRQPASDPAAPSSFLPAHINKASIIFANLLVATPIFVFFIA